MFTLDQFSYQLPPERIAHSPLKQRDQSKLLRVSRSNEALEHLRFADLASQLGPGDVIVRNNTKVIPGRIFGQKTTGGHCEILLVKHTAMDERSSEWECLTRPGLKPGQVITFAEPSDASPLSSELTAECVSINGFTRIIKFNQNKEQLFASLHQIGHTPVPPYIEWQKEDEQKLREIYQTTFAKISGSVAAPTAGLHFTPELDQQLQDNGVQIEEVTLHVGLGTFLPVQPENLSSGKLHQEYYQVSADTAERLNQAKAAGKRIIAVGTTTTRTLETCAHSGTLVAGSGETDLFIQPGYHFQFVDSIITNFHLPESSLLMLICAFVSEPNTSVAFTTFAQNLIGKAYQEAIAREYRFYSFGDAMWIE